MYVAWRCSSSLLLATLVLELELGAEQAAGVIRHPAQPGLVGLPALALVRVACRRPGIVPRFGWRLAGRLLQGLAHALALLAVGLFLACTRGGVAGVRRRVGRRRRALAFGRCLRRGVLATASLWVITRIRGVPAAGRRRVALPPPRRPAL